ncbi:M24 family metallopeptidase [Rhizobium sp. PAMB 3174]
MTPQPKRGFDIAEYQGRVARAQAMMREQGLAALLLTTEPEIRYLSGFLTRFWESPTRPWFLVLPADGAPIAVIPAIGEALMRKTWIADIRTWPSPAPDDGVGLLGDTLRDVVGSSGRVGVPDGPETSVRMPLASFEAVKARLGSIEFGGDAGIMRRLRMIKSEAEIGKIRRACRIGDAAFARVEEIASPGRPLEEVFRRFQMLCLEHGADHVAYLAGGAGPNGYDDVISPAGPTPLRSGDVLMLDTGLVWDGYFCDFDRNFAMGSSNAAVTRAHKQLVAASEAAFAALRPGITAAELKAVMVASIVSDGGTPSGGRFGHGLGMQLTEWPSLIEHDHTVIAENMVLTLEPCVELGGGTILVHEENVRVTAAGGERLTRFASPEIQVV